MPIPLKKLKRIDEISPKNWVHTLDLKRHLYYQRIAKKVIAILAFPLIIGILLYANNSRGQLALLYPSTCLGSWAHSSLAQGEPRLTQGDSPLVFTDENAAIASGRGGELFCGSFDGSLPEDVQLTRVALKVVWNYTEPRYTESDAVGQVVERIIEIPLEEQASSTPELIEDTQEETTSTSTSKESSHEEQAFFSRFFSIARAQEIPLENASSTVQQEEQLVPPPVKESIPQEPKEEPAQATSTPEVIEEVKEELIASSTPETILPDIPPSQDELVMVRYSLDGETWQDLGMLKAGYPLASFEVPLKSQEDIARLQIGFTSLANPKEYIVFIEGMILEVEHKGETSEKDTRKLRQRLPALQHRDFSLDLEAAHDCSVEPFTTIIRQGETKEAVVSARVIPQEQYILEIANLPDYIEGTFIDSGKQFIAMDGIKDAAFSLSAKPQAQKGSFSLTMLIKRPGEDSQEELIAFCQFNVISE